MKKTISFATKLMSIMLLFVLAGCSENAEIAPDSNIKDEVEEVDVSEETDENDGETEAVPESSDENSVETGNDGNSVYTYYSEDGAVYIRQDFNTNESCIVDGDLEIPVDITMGVYGPLISKTDVDGDGQDEYVISECEGTGTGYSVYGLCIVKKIDGKYDLIKYESDYFSKMLEGKITYTFDADTHEVTFNVKNSDTTPFSVTLNRKENLEKVVWSDIIRIRLIDGMPYLSAPSGYVFEDAPVPDYEQAVEVLVPIIISDTGAIDFGEYTLKEDNGIKTP